MSFPSYPSYVETGIRWLGRVPDSWSVVRLKNLVAEVDVRAGAGAGDFELLGLSKSAGIVRRSELDQGGSESDDYSKYKRVEPGQLVMNKMQAWNGVFGLSRFSGIVSPDYSVFEILDASHSAYLSSLLRTDGAAGEFSTRCRGMGTAFLRLNTSDFLDVKVCLPSKGEALAIAAFIDRETGKIDALVEEQRRLIALLKEKRQAVISHAVTKGLNQSAPMKDSGIEWLGEVPAHWRLCLLKRAFANTQYGISETLDGDGNVAVLRMGNIEGGRISFDDLKFVEAVEPSLLVQPRDLLFNRTNSLDQIGKVGMVGALPDCPVSFASYLVRLNLADDCAPEFLSFLLNTSAVLGQARARAFVAIGQCNLNPTRYGEIAVALPPLDEQMLIAKHLEGRTTQFDLLTTEAGSTVALLQERRTALISAAVTGKIDVRGLAPAEAEAA